MIPLVIVTGPTASGKSGVAVWVAEKIGGEIISADSLQVYRHFNIVSDKPDTKIREQVPHHLIDVVSPDEEFNAGVFNEMAFSAAKEIHGKGKIPIVCGGTGLYIKALIQNLALGVPGDPATRERIHKEFNGIDTSVLFEKLKEVDTQSSEKISPTDRYRIERALEVYYSTGTPLSTIHKQTVEEKRFDYKYFILNCEREKLYEKINRRVDEMIDNGAIRELEHILEKGYRPPLKPFKAIGPSQILEYLEGKIDKSAAIEKMKRDTRRFAKRQLTWFRGVKEGEWIDVPEASTPEMIANEIVAKVKSAF